MRSVSPLARVLCAALLAATAFASGQERPKETPRALYERAAFTEEHERDFLKAAELYAAASDAARQTGDDKTAVEASAARDRALARAGQLPKDPATVDCSDPILRRIADLLVVVSGSMQTSPEYGSAVRDLSLFGAAAVPWVERAITESFSLCAYTIVARSDRFVAVLTAMGTPEATAALERTFASPDPVIRRDVASRSNPRLHSSILRRALADPVEAVRRAATSRVADSRDPAWLPEMLDAARAGSYDALEFISHVKPEELAAIAGDLKRDLDFREKALGNLDRGRGLSANVEIPRRLLQIAGALGEDMSLRRDAVTQITKLVDGLWRTAPAAFRQEIESAVTANIDAYPVPEVWDLLLALGGARSLDALTGSIASRVDALDDHQFQRLLNRLSTRFGDLTIKDFDAVVVAFSRIPPVGPLRGNPPTRTQKLYDLYHQMLIRLARPEVPDASMIAALGRLDADHRASFLEVVGAWIDLRGQRIDGQPLRATLDPALVPALRELLAGYEEHQAAAATGYACVGDVRLWPELLRLQSSHDGGVLQAANDSMKDLVAKDPAQAALVLDQALRESNQKNGSLDAALVAGIAYLDRARSLDLFRKLWPLAKDEQSRSALLDVLIQNLLGPEGTAVLFEHYKDIPARKWELRNAAIVRFGNELYQPAVEVLGQALEDPVDRVRKNAREAFAKFKAQREAMEEYKAWMSTDQAARDSVAQLVTLLDNNNRDVVLGAVRSLAALKAKSALPALVKLLERNDPEIKNAVQAAITKIGE